MWRSDDDDDDYDDDNNNNNNNNNDSLIVKLNQYNHLNQLSMLHLKLLYRQGL